ncbi:uncharacterized protein MEPE_01544 [Melanopsichium pennsylvanicum]|uniref:Uncharacterized protein n=2 Tax=Melanopsichium pennsylvanicum TaxID=63383 RepID=A0AAJ4XKL8_9BASI|nr:conserved hypothetical protein [Melanopsichium pennsylvanicum 4]SNX82838.1 uncharacterized protein MEPE_01544 [Melanopsichium pennsylvanicum]
MHIFTHLAILIATLVLLALAPSTTNTQSVSNPAASLPVESYSDDPQITGSAASAALCSLYSILGTESATGRGIGPLTVQPNCLSMTFRHGTSTASINGQTLPSSGVATIFTPPTSTSSSGASVRPTTAPQSSSISSASSSVQSSSSSSSSSESTSAPRQTNAANRGNTAPPTATWIARQNIGVLLFTTVVVLAGITYFLDELLAVLV